MKHSLRTLETLQAALSSTTDEAGNSSHARGLVEERRVKEAARTHQLAKLSPYKRAEYLCLECVAELRSALRDVEELQYTLHGVSPTPSSSSNAATTTATAREERERESAEDASSDLLIDERAQLLGGGGVGAPRRREDGTKTSRHPARRTGEAALLEQELLRARQRARRAHQRLQQLQRDAARFAKTSATTSSSSSSVSASAVAASVAPGERVGGGRAETSPGAAEALDWPRAEKHVELAKLWYREVFGIYTVSSETDHHTSNFNGLLSAGLLGNSGGGRFVGDATASSALQLNRPAQPHSSGSSTSYFGRGANLLPPGVAGADALSEENRSAVSLGWSGTQCTLALGEVDGESSASTASLAPPSQALLLRSARDDAEFAEFFASVQANDDLMDAALDRISEGVARLLDNARGMQDELVIQEELLHGTETRIEANEVALAGMNRRLRRAIRDMNDSSICVYVLCLMALLLILAVLLRVVQ